MALVLKKLVTSSSSSVVVRYLRRPPRPNHPRPFITAARSLLDDLSPRSMVFGCSPKLATKFTKIVLPYIPHTLRITSRVPLTNKDLAKGLVEGDEDATLGESMKFSLDIPGFDKIIEETSENLYIFIDLGLNKNFTHKDLDSNSFLAVLKDSVIKNHVFIEGHVRKQDIRRDYTALVCLPPNIKPDNESFMVRNKNGGIVVTIPKKQETAT